MDALDVNLLNELLEQDVEIREKIKEQASDLDKKSRLMIGILNKIHSTSTDALPPLLDSVRPILRSCHDTNAAIASLVPPNQFWRWKEMWSNSLRTTVYSAALVEYLSSGSLITLAQAGVVLGIKEEWSDRFSIATEDYLHGLISLVNELSRLAVNAVTLGDYEAPLRISVFVKDLYAGFSMVTLFKAFVAGFDIPFFRHRIKLNLKNDNLRRRFDSLKYDLKKIEEVVYDVSLRKLADSTKNILAMDRRRSSTRPASSEEIEYWSHASKSLETLSGIYANQTSIETIGRVNRLMAMWPTDDSLAAESYETLKTNYKRLSSALKEVRRNSEEEIEALNGAIEHVSVLFALRKASETPQEKRNKRPRPPSPSPTSTSVTPPVTAAQRATVAAPARGSTGPSPVVTFSREPRARREALAKQLPLQEGRKVAFHPPAGKTADGSVVDVDENTWILAVITKCINQDKNRCCYNTTLRAIIPLPDPNAPPNSAAHPNAYQEFPAGSIVMALYPDTSCFYRAEVVASPRDIQPSGRGTSSKHISMYKLKFEDDDDQEHSVLAQWVVEWPATMSLSRLLHEFRPLFRVLEEPLSRPPIYGLPHHRSFLADPFFTSPGTVHPALDLTEEGNNYVVEAELPGVKKENIEISVGEGGRSVTIQGRTFSRRPDDSSDTTVETSTSQGESTGAVVSSEPPSNQLTTERLYSGTSSFTRTVWLPHPVDSSQITAKLADGVLTLKAPRVEDKESIKINVD
ncbi:Translin [Tylopilus felleus]